MRFTRDHAARLGDPTAEAVRATQAQQIRELQTVAQQLDERPGRVLAVQRLTTTGTYTPTPGTSIVHVQLQGGGGGGGGASAAAGTVSLAGGGGAGACLDFWLFASAITGGPITIGAAGSGGSAAGGNGGTGGDSSITINGIAYTAKGGTGGQGSTASGTLSVCFAGAPQTGSSSIGTATGNPGQDGIIFSTAAGGAGAAGSGGASSLGLGGLRASFNVVPAAPPDFGGGGAGTASVNANTAGGPGAPGAVLIEEFG